MANTKLSPAMSAALKTANASKSGGVMVCNGWTRGTLEALRRRGLLTSDVARGGYSITDAGREAVGA